MITLALAGKPNCGKSTFFKAATLADAEIANYPFTTIDANHGVAHVRVPCPCTALALPGGAATCGHCTDGVRFIPINLFDVAGRYRRLIPGAASGTSSSTTCVRPTRSSTLWTARARPTPGATRSVSASTTPRATSRSCRSR